MQNTKKTLRTIMYLLKLKNQKFQNYHQHMWFIQWKTTLNQTPVFPEFKEMFQINTKIILILDLIQEEKECFHFQITKKILLNIIIWTRLSLSLKMKTQKILLVKQISWVNSKILKEASNSPKYLLKMKLRYWIKKLSRITFNF